MSSSERVLKEIIRVGPLARDTSSLKIGEHYWLRFELRTRASGEVVSSALIPENDPHIGAVNAHVAKFPTRYRVEFSTVPVDEAARVVAGAGAAGHQVQELLAPAPRSLLQQAVDNGWLAEDLAGAGIGGEVGEAGGRGAFSGLTLAEMADSPAPPRWEAARQTRWPWELPNFTLRAANWTPPRLGRKSGSLQLHVQVFGIAPPSADEPAPTLAAPAPGPGPGADAAPQGVPQRDPAGGSGEVVDEVADAALIKAFVARIMARQDADPATAHALLNAQSQFTAPVIRTLMAVKPNRAGAIPVAKLATALKQAGLSVLPDPTLQAFLSLPRS